MKKLICLFLVLGCGSAQAALVDRGGGFIYDDDLDITWLQDANYAYTSGYDADGKMDWYEWMDWADGLSIYDSVRDVTWDDWRLPTTLLVDPSCGEYYDCAGGEMWHLNHLEGINATCDYDEPPNCESGPFMNLNRCCYVSSTEYFGSNLGPGDDLVFDYDFYMPELYATSKSSDNYALLVRDGDVGASVVPIPAAAWLFGSGLGLLGWIRRRQIAA